MGLIDSKELFLRLYDLWIDTTPSDTDPDDVRKERAAMCRGIDAAMGIVRQCKTVNEWISVKDNPPESFTHLLFAVKPDLGDGYQVFKGEYDGENWYYYSLFGNLGSNENGHIAYWMPEPEPPEEEKNGDKADPV